MISPVKFDAKLIEKYGLHGPRYTSYPTAASFHEGFDEPAYRMHAAKSNEDFIPRSLSLYVHLPFCRSLCYYCACNKKITRREEHGERYLATLQKEIKTQGQLFDADRCVRQLHLGGGTPTFFDDPQLEKMLAQIQDAFTLDTSGDREFGIEIDPRTVDAQRLGRLAAMGFNRLSLGVQDLDHNVQNAVNRVQDPEATLGMVDAARQQGFDSVSLDLIYGLPLQSLKSFEATLDAILDVRPDRLSVYNYAHMPERFRAQRLIKDEDLPSADERLAILASSIERLLSAGYVFIGMDHFALPDDELSLAREAGTLQRNFQGYSTHGDCDLVGLGVSAISRIGNCYAQNQRDLRSWSASVESGQLPVGRGCQLSGEDQLRRRIIDAVMCHGSVDFDAIGARHGIEFNEHLALELQELEDLQRDGLVLLEEQGLSVTATGMLLLRAVAMVFDESLRQARPAQGFSRVI